MAQQNPDIPIDQVNKMLENAITGFDQTRSSDLTSLSLLRSVKFTALERDRARLAAKLGPDHPRVSALDQQLALNKEVQPAYAAEAAISSNPPPDVAAPAWALYGVVVDVSRAPVAGVTVALFQGDTEDRALGSACTSANGTFQIVAKDVTKFSTAHSIRLQKDKKTYVDPSPVTPAAGQAEHREIVLDPAQIPCKSVPSEKPKRKSK